MAFTEAEFLNKSEGERGSEDGPADEIITAKPQAPNSRNRFSHLATFADLFLFFSRFNGVIMSLGSRQSAPNWDPTTV